MNDENKYTMKDEIKEFNRQCRAQNNMSEDLNEELEKFDKSVKYLERLFSLSKLKLNQEDIRRCREEIINLYKYK